MAAESTARADEMANMARLAWAIPCRTTVSRSPGVITTDRIDQVLEPSYSADLAARDSDRLRAMKAECAALETAVSYSRRLAQGRIEILEAEQQRRSDGRPLSDLIDKLPQILGGDSGRAGAAHTRLAEPEAAIVELRWPDGRERLLADDSLANLPTVTDSDLTSTLESLRSFERELSEQRRALHGVIDGIEHEIATRAAAGN